MIVMQNLYIVHGKPAWSSTYISAAVHARFKHVRVVMDGEGKDRGCVVRVLNDDGEVLKEGTRVTMEMAELEGWIKKAGSKWKTMPDLMLQYRSLAFFGRVHCPDVLLGIQSEHEVHDVVATVSDIQVADPFKTQPDVVDAEVTDDEVVDSLVDGTLKALDGLEGLPGKALDPEPEEVKVQDKCFACACNITPAEKSYSEEKWGKPLCRECQKFQ